MGWALNFWNSTIGKKAVMAVTGLVGLGFVLVHMLGNLQVYLGAEKLNGYAQALHANAAILWGARTVLLLAILGHVLAAVELQGVKNAARPVRYQKPAVIQATPASRTMIVSGLLLLAFIFYHLSHLTWGGTHPQFVPMDAYGNVVRGFSSPDTAVNSTGKSQSSRPSIDSIMNSRIASRPSTRPHAGSM